MQVHSTCSEKKIYYFQQAVWFYLLFIHVQGTNLTIRDFEIPESNIIHIHNKKSELNQAKE